MRNAVNDAGNSLSHDFKNADLCCYNTETVLLVFKNLVQTSQVWLKAVGFNSVCAADEPTAWTHPLNVLVTVQSCVLCPAQASVSTTSCTTSSPCATPTRTWTSTSTASSAAWFGSKPCSVSQCTVTNILCRSCGVFQPCIRISLCVLICFCFFVYLSFSPSCLPPPLERF